MEPGFLFVTSGFDNPFLLQEKDILVTMEFPSIDDLK